MRSTSAALYGKGIFTTIAVRDGERLFWQKHWRRLVVNADKLGIELSDHTEGAVLADLDHEIAKFDLTDGRVRITVFDERQTDLWHSQKSIENKTSLQILIGSKRELPEQFRLTTSPFPVNSRSPLAGVKSSNYLEQILSLEEANGRGFHEAVRVNERRHVTSGSMSNIFWIKNERLYTPTLTTGCLAGTTREYVLENIDCEEVEAEIGELNLAEAIFLTSAGLGIIRVGAFDDRTLVGSDNSILELWPPKHTKTRMPTRDHS